MGCGDEETRAMGGALFVLEGAEGSRLVRGRVGGRWGWEWEWGLSGGYGMVWALSWVSTTGFAFHWPDSLGKGTTGSVPGPPPSVEGVECIGVSRFLFGSSI